jgi:hypothetical protein
VHSFSYAPQLFLSRLKENTAFMIFQPIKTAIMKSVLLSLSALFVTLVSINTATAQAVKFHAKEPPTVTLQPVLQGNNIVFQICVSGTLYGVGNASSVDASLQVAGTASTLCFNKGEGTGQEGGAVPGQSSFTVSSPTLTFAATNGSATFSLCVTIGGSCKGAGMDHFEVTDVDLSDAFLVVNGKNVSLRSFIN